MESTLQKPALVAAKTTPKARNVVYWIVTALFCLQMSFTAYGNCACRRWRRRSLTSASPPTSGWNSLGPSSSAWGWAAATGVLWGLSYFLWRRLQATLASA